MRVIRDERGAALVIVAIVLPLLVGMGALTVDAGAAWTARRVLTTATDAAALAGASAAILGEDPCDEADDLVASNAPEADVEDCTVTGGITGGSVGVVASEGVTVRFGRALGIDDQQVSSASSAAWGVPTHVTNGLRPIGLCASHPVVASWLAGVDVDAHEVSRLPFTKSSPDLCGATAAGNWGWFDLDGGSNSDAEIVAWVEGGFDGTVGVDDCDGDRVRGDRCEAASGSRGSSVAAALDLLVDSGETFAVPVYDLASGGGANVRYRIAAFAVVRLHGHRVTGAEQHRYVDLSPDRMVVEGICCEPGPTAGAYAIRLCAADLVGVCT